MPDFKPDQPLLEQVGKIAKLAGQTILALYRRDMAVDHKADQSPVTEADRAAEAIILPHLHKLTPDIPVVSEESFDGTAPEVDTKNIFWLVDPLDGTKEFIAGNSDFTVNIALVCGQQPVLGVVYAPATDQLYLGHTQGGALKESQGTRAPIRCRPSPAAGLTVVASRFHTDADALAAYLQGKAIEKTIGAGSSLKFCLLAEGKADLYPRLGRTMEWDTAAGHAVLSAAGGFVHTADGKPLLYGKAGFANPHFIAKGLT